MHKLGARFSPRCTNSCITPGWFPGLFLLVSSTTLLKECYCFQIILTQQKSTKALLVALSSTRHIICAGEWAGWGRFSCQTSLVVFSVWEVGTLAAQKGARQAAVDGKRGLSIISRLWLWMAWSSFLLLLYSTTSCQGWNDGSAFPGVRRRELPCANWDHQSKLLEVLLGIKEHFFKKNEKT